MNNDFSVLRDPDNFESTELNLNKIISKSGKEYEIIDRIPRFVDRSNYSDDFGFQWKKFFKTQLDSYSGLTITEDRLKRCLGEPFQALENKLILEAGSGAGRFTEILLKFDANVHSFDYSSAVDANAMNNGSKERLTLVQADIRKIPFEKGKYDFVVCLGVLQHTPNPEESIKSLWDMLKPGGKLIIGTPDFDSGAARRYESNFRLLHDKTHISLFSCDSMHRYLRDHGFEYFSIYHIMIFVILSHLSLICIF